MGPRVRRRGGHGTPSPAAMANAASGPLPREDFFPRLLDLARTASGGRPRPRDDVAADIAVALHGRPRPLVGGGDSGPSLGALPFSSAVNLLTGAMVAAVRIGGERAKS